MFTCPNCAQELQPQRGPHGVIYSCPVCKGRAASLAVLRKVFGPERVATLLRESFQDDAPRGCACPICRREMVRVAWMEKERAITLDLCRRCEFVWFDPDEYEALTPAGPAPHRLGDVDISQLPVEVREEIAMEKVREIARQADREQEQAPDLTWKNAPALFGLPVEMDEVGEPRTPVATYSLSAVIAVASLWAFLFHYRTGQDVAAALGLIPARAGRDLGLTFLTSFFLHGSLWHLASNLYFLVVFGRHVEAYLGKARWLLVTAVAALTGDLLDVACRADSMVPLIGASGGISGLLAFYAFKFPHARLGMLFYLRFYFRWINLPAWGAFAIWILLQLWGAFLELRQMGNVASLAHLGGVLAGIGFWVGWRNLDAKPAAPASPLPVVEIR